MEGWSSITVGVIVNCTEMCVVARCISATIDTIVWVSIFSQHEHGSNHF